MITDPTGALLHCANERHLWRIVNCVETIQQGACEYCMKEYGDYMAKEAAREEREKTKKWLFDEIKVLPITASTWDIIRHLTEKDDTFRSLLFRHKVGLIGK